MTGTEAKAGDKKCEPHMGKGDRETRRFELPEIWFQIFCDEHVREESPGIYEWRIPGVGCYIGKYSRIRRPLKEYGRNVVRLLKNKPYRKSDPCGFRPIHRALAEAIAAKKLVELHILENVSKEHLHSRERQLINQRKKEEQEGTSLHVLNGN